MVVEELRALVRDIPDHPQAGVVFKDITPLLADADAFRVAIDGLAAPFAGSAITHVVGIEARGFIVAAPVALLSRPDFAAGNRIQQLFAAGQVNAFRADCRWRLLACRRRLRSRHASRTKQQDRRSNPHHTPPDRECKVKSSE